MYPRGFLTPAGWVRLGFTTLIAMAFAVALFVGELPIIGSIILVIAVASAALRISVDQKIRRAGNVEKKMIPPGPVADRGRKLIKRMFSRLTIGFVGVAVILAIVAIRLPVESRTIAWAVSGTLIVVAGMTFLQSRLTMRRIFIPPPKP